MEDRADLVLAADRHLKWRALDPVERVLMQLCGVCLVGFTSTTLLDVMARVAGHPLLWPQEVTSAFFIYGVFIGASVATRRGDHLQLSALTEAMGDRARRFFEVFNRAVIAAVGLCLAVYGWQNFLTGFGSFRMPSMLPIAYLYAPIPLCGALVALFSLEQIVNGLQNGFWQTAAGRGEEVANVSPPRSHGEGPGVGLFGAARDNIRGFRLRSASHPPLPRENGEGK